IREVVQDKRMPPWHADPHYGKFANDRSLSEEEQKTLLTWIDQGCPKGADKDLPPPRTFESTEWRIGKPDAVFDIGQDVEVPAKARGGKGIPYRHYMADTNFKEDMWVQA